MPLSELPPEPLAEGRVSLVYPWGEGKILKLARDWVPPDWVGHEYRIAEIVHASGLRVPQPHALIQVDGRSGIVYDRVDGRTMLDRIGTSPHRAISFGKTLGRLHAAVHLIPGDEELPETHDRLRRKIEAVEGAPEPARKLALEQLARLPKGSALLHGDFHPGNLVMTDQGPITIDWPDASRGHPLADVARSVILASLGGLPAQPVLRILVRGFRAAFREAYLRAYFRISPLKRKDLRAWMYPVLFARLSEGIESELALSIRWVNRLAEKEFRAGATE